MSFQDQTTSNQGTDRAENLQTGDILETASRMGEISRFVTAVREAGMETELRADGFRTLFAPLDEMIAGISGDLLRATVAKHIVRGRQLEADLRTTSQLKTVDGDSVPVQYDSKGSRFGEARIVRRDVICRNGIIHVIDGPATRSGAE
ncbi:MAG TPA: fasciclin domain-containing protein [Bryobacteraceae bacterium]|nr:fasciclin domain-containing protein [Bryobacteraceae bacterium]